MKTLALTMVRGEVLEFAKLLSLATCCVSSLRNLFSSMIGGMRSRLVTCFAVLELFFK